MPYATELNESLGAAVEQAAKEWTEAEVADEKYQALQASVRELTELVAADLKAFRRTLRAVIGTRDVDHEKLRLKRAHLDDEDDDENAPSAPGEEPDAPDAPDDPDAPIEPVDTAEPDEPAA